MAFDTASRDNLYLNRKGNKNEWEPKRLKSLGDFLVGMGLLNERANSGGDCYEAAGKYMMDKCVFSSRVDGCNLILVHGEVAGQGSLEGVTFGHAWVLDGGTAIDRSNGGNLQLPRAVYYAVGQINQIGNTHEYTMEEMRKKILNSGHWGPWDLETESGL